MCEKQIFETRLEKHGKMDATSIKIPFDVKAVFGAKRVSKIAESVEKIGAKK